MTPNPTETLISEIRKQAATGARLVFVSGNFNIVHPGHLRLLRFAAECGDFLIVGVRASETEGAVLPAELRLDGVRSIGFVNYAFLLTEGPEAFIAKLRPATVVKGKEHEVRDNPERAIVESYGGKLLFSSGELLFSSLDLLQREFRELNFSSVIKPADFPARHGFTISSLKTVLDKFKGLRIAVIGDLIVDEYINCEPLGMSQEDPTIVVSPIREDRFIGGAAIVAAHARSLGAEVSYFSIGGRDKVLDFARTRLNEYGVTAHILEDDSRPTTLKQRFRADGKTLLRVSHLRQHDVNRGLVDQLSKAVTAILPRTDLLIFSDFNYGCLPQILVNTLCERAARANVRMVADSQSSSQVGDVSRFKGMMLLTPTEREARLAVRDFSSGLVVLAEALRLKSETKNIVITLGSEGVLAHLALDNPGEWLTDRLPALNTAPKDSAGAGDSFLTCSAMALICDADLWQSIYLGSLAAACQVGRVGNIPLTLGEIKSEIDA